MQFYWIDKICIGKKLSNLDPTIIIQSEGEKRYWSNLEQKYWSNLDQTMLTKFRLMDINKVFKERWLKCDPMIIKFGSNYNNWSNLQQKYWSNLDQTIWTKFRLIYFNQISKKYWIVELVINNVSLGYLCCSFIA